jgi:hypothetical protein
MTTIEDAQAVLVDLIIEAAGTKPDTGQTNAVLGVHKAQAEAILKLAEAHAWLGRPDQPHG